MFNNEEIEGNENAVRNCTCKGRSCYPDERNATTQTTCVCVCVCYLSLWEELLGLHRRKSTRVSFYYFLFIGGGIWFQMLIVESWKIIRWIVLNGYDDYNRFGWSSHAFWLWFQCTIQTHTCVCVWKRLIEIVKKYILKKKMKELCQKGVWIFVVVGCSSVLNITSMHKPKVYVVFFVSWPPSAAVLFFSASIIHDRHWNHFLHSKVTRKPFFSLSTWGLKWSEKNLFFLCVIGSWYLCTCFR